MSHETVWKYHLDITGEQTLNLPRGAQVLHIGEQHGNLNLWALIEPSKSVEPRNFILVGTGQPAPSITEARHVGSAVTENGAYVWHLFEVPA